ncbi:MULTISPECIES: polyprenyl synthetase family protein [unclassified Nocardioides]|uniref:polyprenyl synthetase family protein n=1 Tax=unclassified Nocardioides TaxID=2615069 RepID=UPI00301439B8
MTVAEVRRDDVVGPRELDPEGIRSVDRVLSGRVETHAEVLLQVSDDLVPLVGALRTAASGGKRLRAAFCLWGARAASGGVDVVGGTEAAAALEMFHLGALVHDDLMDHSDDRRGRPTVHRRFADRHRDEQGLGDPDEHGAAVAVLAGDLCLTWSDDLLADAVHVGRPGTAPAVRAVWTRMRDQVLAGQYLDVLGDTRPRISADQVGRVLRFKSASYTVEHPLLLGAALAGAEPGLLDRLGAFGLRVGEAFQLRDDVLGVFGDPAVTGKPAVDDVREGKRTLLVAVAEERGDEAQRAVLRRTLGHTEVDESGLEAVREVMTASGALAHVEERIETLARAARRDLAALAVDERSRWALGALTDACAWRAA